MNMAKLPSDSLRSYRKSAIYDPRFFLRKKSWITDMRSPCFNFTSLHFDVIEIVVKFKNYSKEMRLEDFAKI